MKEVTDRRSKRTESILRNAFLSLLKNTPIDKISVSKLVEEANLGRGTFYLHYKDIPDMVSHLQDMCMNKLIPLLEEHASEPDIEPFLTELYHIIEQEKDLAILFVKKTDGAFYQKMQAFARKKCEADWIDLFQASPEKMNLFFSYLFGGMANLVWYWITQDQCQTPPEKMAFYTKCMIFNGLDFMSTDYGV